MNTPNLHAESRLAPGAHVFGDVTLDKGVNVWFNAVIRADVDAVRIGENTNVQDGAVLHVSHGFPLIIGKNVTIGHGAIVHGCTIADDTLIGMGAIILDGATIGKGCIVAAGSLVPSGMDVPDGSLVMGSPAKYKRPVSESELESSLDIALRYAKRAAKLL